MITDTKITAKGKSELFSLLMQLGFENLDIPGDLNSREIIAEKDGKNYSIEFTLWDDHSYSILFDDIHVLDELER